MAARIFHFHETSRIHLATQLSGCVQSPKCVLLLFYRSSPKGPLCSPVKLISRLEIYGSSQNDGKIYGGGRACGA